MPTIAIRLKRFVQQEKEKWNKLPLRTKTKVYAGLVGLALANLLFTLFCLYTLISVAVFLAAATLFIKLRVDALLDRGIMSLFSKKTQKVLLERSIFDFLCDTWFMPKISLYLKAILRPFFVAIEPEDAVHQFEDLPEAGQKLFLQKGIVNLLPKKVKNAMLPKALRNVNSEDDHDENDHENNEDDDSTESRQSHTNEPVVFSHSLEHGASKTSLEGDKLKDSEIISSKDKASIISTDDEPRNLIRNTIAEAKHWISLEHDSDRKPTKPKKKGADFKLPKKLEKSYIFDPVDGTGYRSEVISSNKMSPPLKKHAATPTEVQKWDKLDTFLKLRQEKLKQGNKTARKPAPMKGPLAVIHNLKNFLHLSKQGFLHHIDEKKLLKVFILSSIGLLTQFTLSKKTRAWLYHTFHLLAYVAGILLSSGSLALYILKLKKKAQQNQQSLENPENQAHHSEGRVLSD